MLQPAKQPDPEVVADAHRLAAAGADRETILVFVRDRAFDKIDSINVLRTLYGLTMPEAKQLVDHSAAWSDRFYTDMELHKTAWKALRDLAASNDPELPRIIIEGDPEKS